MNLKQLFADEDAVSPVIGVILMVAITVILAAVIGTFVLGLGENVQDSAPQANFQFEYAEGSTDGFGQTEIGEEITITHTGGEDVARSELSVQVGEVTFDDLTTSNSSVNSGWSDPVATGSAVTLNETDNSNNHGPFIASNDDVRVVWTSPSGGTSNTIGQSTVPS